MFRNNVLFALVHDPNAAPRIVHFFLVFMVKPEICVTKQR